MSEENAQPQAEVKEPATIPEKSEESGEQTTPQKFKVKYNKEEKELTYDEAVTYAQKGMNYDHVYGELQELKNDEALVIADRIAARHGITRAELLKKWEAELDIDTYAEENEVPKEVAKAAVADRKKAEALEEENRKLKSKMEIDAQLREFRAAYPDLKDEDVPDAALEIWKNKPGLTILEAYELYKLKEGKKAMDTEAAAKKTNDDNAKSSMGSVQGQPSQPFKVTEEWIKNASLQEYEAHRDEIKDWYFNKRKG